MADIRALVSSNTELLQSLGERTIKLRAAYPSLKAPHSIFDARHDDTGSIFSHVASSAGITEFEFDDHLLGSAIYRRAFMGGYLRPRMPLDSDSEAPSEVTTIQVDNPAEDWPLSSATEQSSTLVNRPVCQSLN